MIEIEHFLKLLTLLKIIEDDQNININIQCKSWPLNGVHSFSIRCFGAFNLLTSTYFFQVPACANKMVFNGPEQNEDLIFFNSKLMVLFLYLSGCGSRNSFTVLYWSIPFLNRI